MATVRKVSRALVISAFGWCGFKDFEKKKNEELSKKMERILDVLPLNEEPPNDEIRELIATAKTLFADGGSFEVIDDGDLTGDASSVSASAAVSDASDDLGIGSSDLALESETKTVATDAPAKGRRGRKPKPKPENETAGTTSSVSTGGQVDTTDQTKPKGRRGRKPKAAATETATAAATTATKSRGRKPKASASSQTTATGNVKLSHCVGHVLKKYGDVTDEGVSEVCSLLDLPKKERAAVRSCMESSMDVIRGYVSGVVKKTVEVLVLG